MPRLPLPRPWLGLTAAALTALLSAAPARAEEGEGPQDPRAKLKAQVEKILKLMHENEKALLEASTLGGQQPKGPDVPIPDLPPSPGGAGSGGAGAGGQGAGQGGAGQGGAGQGGAGEGGAGGQGGGQGGGARGEEIRKKLDELLRGQQSAGKIPDELAELVRMVPKGSSGGKGQPQPQDGSEGGGDTPEAREQRRKQLEEQQKREQEGKDGQDPKGGPKSPKDPSGRGKPDDPQSQQPPQDPNIKAWLPMLPPEMRELFSGGASDRLPPRVSEIIEQYMRSLRRATSPGAGR